MRKLRSIVLTLVLVARVAWAAAPTVDVTVEPTEVVLGGQATVTWSSAGAESCLGDWSADPIPLSGSVTVTPAADTTYSVTCTAPPSPPEQTTAAATVSVLSPTPTPEPTATSEPTATPQPTPTPAKPYILTFTVSPTGGMPNTERTIAWTTKNVDTCSASSTYTPKGGTSSAYSWLGPKPVNGSDVFTPTDYGEYVFTLSCDGPGGAVEQTIVFQVPEALNVTFAHSITGKLFWPEGTGGTCIPVTITWSSTNAKACTCSWLTLSGADNSCPASGEVAMVPACEGDRFEIDCEQDDPSRPIYVAPLEINPSSSLQVPTPTLAP